MFARAILGTSCAALLAFGASASAATSPESAAANQRFTMFGNSPIDAFYAARHGAPLWLSDGPTSPAATELVRVLIRSSVEGFTQGPGIGQQAQALMARAATGDPSALAEADRLLSNGWVQYVSLLRQRPTDMAFAEPWIAPRVESPVEILQTAAAAPSLADHVRGVADVNPIYSALRDAAWSQSQGSSGAVDPRLQANLERTRIFPSKGRFIVVDAASAKLWMVEDGKLADSMKVIVGKPDSQTPMIASVIHYATLNPYWNVPPDMVRSMIAQNVLSQGPAYLKVHGYQLLSDFSDNPQILSAADVDWHAVAEGRTTIRVRQLPGAGNSMGHLKFGFANDQGVYLHDTPKKELFASDDRDLSHGCVRLEDAARLGRWLLGREPTTASTDPEQHVLLPKPIPVYVTYLTAHADNGQLTLLDDPYGRDGGAGLTMAGLR